MYHGLLATIATVLAATWCGAEETVPLGSIGFNTPVYASTITNDVYGSVDRLSDRVDSVSNAIPDVSSFVDKSVTNGLASQNWVEAFHYVDKSVTNGLASQSWVEGRKYVTEAVTNGLASQNWVDSFHYVDKSVTNGLASQNWVEGKKYVTESVTNGLASRDWVDSFHFVDKSVTNGLASQSWVDGKEYVTRVVTNGLASQAWVDGRKYVTDSVTNGLAPISMIPDVSSFVGKSVTNGRASTNYVDSSVNDEHEYTRTNFLSVAFWNANLAPTLQGLIDAKASTNDLNDATNRIRALEIAGYVTKDVTNGLASTAWVDGKGYATTDVLGTAFTEERLYNATNYISAGYWNTVLGPQVNAALASKASTNDFNSVTNRLKTLEDAGYVTEAVTNGLSTADRWFEFPATNAVDLAGNDLVFDDGISVRTTESNAQGRASVGLYDGDSALVEALRYSVSTNIVEGLESTETNVVESAASVRFNVPVSIGDDSVITHSVLTNMLADLVRTGITFEGRTYRLVEVYDPSEQSEQSESEEEGEGE